jgi:predicted nucleic acid-binding protein
VKGIADTGFIVAFVNRNDRFHDWALSIAAAVTEPLLTCDAVLAESAFHLRDAAIVLALVRDQLLLSAFDLMSELEHVRALAERYADREPDLADLCLIRMSELHPRRQVITVDRADFRVYRRNKRDVIPLVHPPDA